MKISKFNHYFSNEHVVFVYNALTNALVEMTNDEFKELKFIENVEIKNKDYEKDLIENGLVYHNQNNETDRIILDMYKERFKTDSIGLTIAPTLDCNFSCPYCYEGKININQLNMTEDTENAIVDYITMMSKSIKSLGVAWYGGEPLLQLNTIKNLSEKIIKVCIDNDIYYEATMTTNGYLLDYETYLKLEKLNISSIQIPLDGDNITHDITRHTKGSLGSFNRITNNLKEISSCVKDTTNRARINLRINITKNNKDSLENLLNILRKDGILEFASYYIARIDDLENPENENILNEKEFNEFSKNHFKSIDLSTENKIKMLYPKTIKSSCVNDRIYDFVIAPDGSLYKCWEEIGVKERAVGNITDIYTLLNTRLSLRSFESNYVFNPLNDYKCQNCKILPICMGGNCHKLKKYGNNVDCEFRVRDLHSNIKDILKSMGHKDIKQIFI